MNPEAALKTRRREGQLALAGMELKEQGIASRERHHWLRIARGFADWYCRHQGWVTSDFIHREMDSALRAGRAGAEPHDNCYGAIFHDSRFKWTGERVRSTRPEAHGREIRVWRLA